MLPDTLQRRLESIPDLSKQGKRINGLSRLMAEPLLWEQAYTEIASNRGALTPGVTGETLDGFSLSESLESSSESETAPTALPIGAPGPHPQSQR